MAAIDTFEWYITSTIRNPSPELQRYLTDQRQYLYALRSEDERQRFVEGTMHNLFSMISSREKPRGTG